MNLKKIGKNRSNINGITILKKVHPEVRKLLDKNIIPYDHGDKVWPSSIHLIEYLKKNVKNNCKTLEIGCGFAPLSIYLSKYKNAKASCMDKDKNVFPYIELHEKYNKAAVTKLVLPIEKITKKLLSQFDILLGADICYSEKMFISLLKLIKKAKNTALKEIIIADPVRWPYSKLVQNVSTLDLKSIKIINDETLSLIHINYV